jgi:hypothetical protein
MSKKIPTTEPIRAPTMITVLLSLLGVKVGGEFAVAIFVGEVPKAVEVVSVVE